jgi:hypothetical protein
MFRSAAFVAVVLANALSAGGAPAHEFWIAHETGVLDAGDPIIADLKVGRNLLGEPYPYLSSRFTRFTVTVDGETLAVSGNEGDIPAMATIPARPGLNIIAHQTIAYRVTYDDWSIFRNYLVEEGLDNFAKLHRARGLPEQGFAERYTRHAKALVQAGPVMPDDADSRVGLLFELVAEANPYTTGLDALPVSLTWRGEPVEGQQISIFRNAGDNVTRSTVITDSSGRAIIPLDPGSNYLLNAVRLEPAMSDPVVWQSHWASLSFGIGDGRKLSENESPNLASIAQLK